MLEALEKDTALDGGMDAIKGRRLRGLRSVHESWGRGGHKSEHNMSRPEKARRRQKKRTQTRSTRIKASYE